MKFLLRLSVVLAIVALVWLWFGGPFRGEALMRMPPLVRHVVSSVLTVEENIRQRVQMVQSGATMIKEGRAMIEKGVRGSRN
ncbi:hypothetical protein HY464_00540 [Candidatus Peregrinibacteria bacterium]|nr:hypothetical protein [Candidatus Peregrinibacteria bacterium]MBI2523932.1 hypothetical protein [Candidatus Peregrinibacteria bacterium]MBI4129161.1 hypothetical protein [Candidatus Peregrinibacteria bacterium]